MTEVRSRIALCDLMVPKVSKTASLRRKYFSDISGSQKEKNFFHLCQGGWKRPPAGLRNNTPMGVQGAKPLEAFAILLIYHAETAILYPIFDGEMFTFSKYFSIKHKSMLEVCFSS